MGGGRLWQYSFKEPAPPGVGGGGVEGIFPAGFWVPRNGEKSRRPDPFVTSGQ